MKKYLWLLILLLFVSQLVAGGKAEHGSSLEFDGDSSHVLVNDHASLQISSDFTLLAWFNTTTAPSFDKIIGVVGKGDTADGGLNHNYFLVLDNDVFNAGNGEGLVGGFENDAGGNYMAVCDTSIPVDNKWHQFGVTFDDSEDDVFLYLDTTQIAENLNATGTVATNAAKLAIGRLCGNDAGIVEEYFAGTIDEVMVYSRTLSPTEIAWLYRHPGAIYDTTSLEEWLKFNEFTGVTAGDSSANSNDGTLTNNPIWTIETPVKAGKEK